MASDTVTTEGIAAPLRRRRVLLGRVLLALVLVAGVVVSWRWFANPNSLDPYYGDVESAPLTIGQPLYADTLVGPNPSSDGTGPTSTALTIDSVTPVIEENTAHADITFLMCVRNSGNLGIGVQVDGLAKSCTRTDAFTGPTDLNLGFSTGQIVAVVTAHQSGVIHIAGYVVTYHQGIRRGSQLTGAGMTFTASG